MKTFNTYMPTMPVAGAAGAGYAPDYDGSVGLGVKSVF
jgi:hypothetical protein